MNKRIKVLFLAANPVDAGYRLRLDEEIREIGKKLRIGEHRDSFELVSEWAVRPSDLEEALLRHKPHIVHFSGHGSKTQGIALEDDAGKTRLINKQAIASLFKILKDNIRLVVLNACYAKDQAEGLTDTIDYTIGMNDAVGDKAAIIFAAYLYQSLAFNRTVSEAFKLAQIQLELDGISGSAIPELLVREGVELSVPFLTSIWNSDTSQAAKSEADQRDTEHSVSINNSPIEQFNNVKGDGNTIIGKILH